MGIINIGLIEDIVEAIEAFEYLKDSTSAAIPKIEVKVPQYIKNILL